MESRKGSTGKREDISIYDVEPDKCKDLKAGLPRRSRYYSDLIDVQLLEKNTQYDKLPELVTIFILSYDPFGENAMYYEAGTVLKTHPTVNYDDGIRRIFLYVGGNLSDQADKAEQSLKNLLVYINESKTENATDDNTKKLDAIVRSTKAKKGIGVEYMKSWERESYIKEKGREEGRLEERINTEHERKRADEAEQRVVEAEKRATEAEKRAIEAEKRIADLEDLITSKQPGH